MHTDTPPSIDDNAPAPNEKPARTSPTGSGIALGISIGTALGITFDQLPIGIALGVAFGAALDGAAHARRKKP